MTPASLAVSVYFSCMPSWQIECQLLASEFAHPLLEAKQNTVEIHTLKRWKSISFTKDRTN